MLQHMIRKKVLVLIHRTHPGAQDTYDKKAELCASAPIQPPNACLASPCLRLVLRGRPWRGRTAAVQPRANYLTMDSSIGVLGHSAAM